MLIPIWSMTHDRTKTPLKCRQIYSIFPLDLMASSFDVDSFKSFGKAVPTLLSTSTSLTVVHRQYLK